MDRRSGRRRPSDGGRGVGLFLRPVDRGRVIDGADGGFRCVILRSGPSRDGRWTEARVEVLHRIKGRVPRFVTVRSVPSGVMCGYPLPIGAELDLAGRFDAAGRLGVGMCGMVPLDPRPPRVARPR